MRVTYRLVDEHNNLYPTGNLQPHVTIPGQIVGVKFRPGNRAMVEEDVLELTIEIKTYAKFIYTNEDRKKEREK